MHPFKITTLAGAVLLALSGASAQAQSNSEVQALKGTVESLRKQVDELRELLTKQAASGALAAPPAAAPDESQESVDARTPANKADIVGLRADLENYKYDQSRLQERNIPSVLRNTRIGGSLTLRHDFQNPGAQPSANSSGNGATDPRQSGFNAASFGLNFSGNLFRDYEEGRDLTYRLSFNSSTTATAGTSTFNLQDAYLRYSFLPATGNREDPLGTITLGQQNVAFGQDAQAIDPEVKAVINNALFVSGLGLNQRQTGVAIAGDFAPYVDFSNNYRAPLIAYSLGLFNGNGPNKADNNDYRDVAARLVYTVPADYTDWFRQIQIGVSYYKGYTSLGAVGTGAYLANGKGDYDRQGFDINWTHLPYSISYEWALGKQDLASNDPQRTTNPDGQKTSVGQYINFGYTWGEQFLASSRQQGKYDDFWPKSYQAFLRLDSWDPNRSGLSTADKQFATTLGLNVFFAETTKLQVNYVRTRSQLGGAILTDAKPETSNLWQLQLNAGF